MRYDLFVFVGETSGDCHGAVIIEKFKQMYPKARIEGVIGPRLREEGVDEYFPMENFQIMGYTDVFKNIVRLISYFRKIRDHILTTKPKAVLFIDYPGFNLRMAKALRKKNFKGKLIHYICPTVWAHGKKRIYTLSKTLDLLLSIFPFEEKYFKKTNLKPSYVGHPLIEKAQKETLDLNWKEKHLIDEKVPLVGIFPGSRSQEIKENFSKILESCKLYHAKFPQTRFVISVLNQKLKKLMEQDLKACSIKDSFLLLSSSENFQIMSHVDAAIATSGTITFELGVMKVPTVVVYHLTPLNAWIARYVIKLNLPYYCIVNIITKKHVFPELYHLDFIPQNVSDTLERLMSSSYFRENSLKGCEEMLKLMLTHNIPSYQAAEQIGSLVYAG